MKSLLIGTIDQSTTATKFVVFNQLGKQIEKTIIEHTLITPKQGWLEHNPQEIWKNCQSSIEQTLKKLEQKGYTKDDIKTIGITNQRETVVAWNKQTGIPYHNAIVWNDIRTQQICNEFTQKHGGNKNEFSKITGLPINTYFSAFKIKWLMENAAELQNEKQKDNIIFGTMDSWVLWNLTNGTHKTDVTNASRTFLMNLNTLKYEDNLLKEFGINQESLPEINPTASIHGEITYKPLKGIPISSMVGDQQSASIGHGLFNEGSSKSTYGSGCFLQVNQGTVPKFQQDQGLLTTVLYQFGKESKPVYAFEGAIEAGALTLNWARENLQLYKDFGDLQKQVDTVENTGGVYFIPTLSGAYTPYWNENARGSITGMSLYTKKAHILRALLEGIAYRTKDVLNCVEKSGVSIDQLNVDGGVTQNQFLMQFQSNILQKKIIKTDVMDSTCLGAAFAAGIGAGIYKDVNQLSDLIHVAETIDFDPEFKKEAQQLYGEWQNQVNKSFNH